MIKDFEFYVVLAILLIALIWNFSYEFLKLAALFKFVAGGGF